MAALADFDINDAKLIRRAVELRDAADDENREPNAIVKKLAALAPGTFSPVKSRNAPGSKPRS